MTEICENSKNNHYTNIIDLSINLSEIFCEKKEKNERKPIGQFFTPPEIANFMSSQIQLPQSNFSLLDPGAGTGILISAICDRVYREYTNAIELTIHAYENDHNIIPDLEKTLTYCRSKLAEKGHRVNYKIFAEDFIETNSKYLSKDTIYNLKHYDLVISNPPYYKLNIDSYKSEIMADFVFGQPNIYSFFVILATMMLKENGQFVYITPRSFCSGLYYKKMRKWLLENTCITKIHTFISRNNIFHMDKVLQEVLIISGEATNKKKCKPIEITSSSDKFFSDIETIICQYSYLNPKGNEESYIRIPSSQSDIKIFDIVDSWNHKLLDFDIKISTGKVVDFRTTENLTDNYDKKGTVPLIWMQNLDLKKINISIENFEKPQGILFNENTKRILIPIKNYVLLKRFTTKNEKKRLFAVPFPKKEFKQFKYIGIENHINYIYKSKGELSLNEMYGVLALLNSNLIDNYIRTISGHTQVNATDIRNLPIPNYENLIKLGKHFRNNNFNDCSEYIKELN